MKNLLAVITLLLVVALNCSAQLRVVGTSPVSGSTVSLSDIDEMSLVFNQPVNVKNSWAGQCVTVSDLTVGGSFIYMKGTVDPDNAYKVILTKAKYGNTGDFYEGHRYSVDVNNYAMTFFTPADGSEQQLEDYTFNFSIEGGAPLGELYVARQIPARGEILRNAGSIEFNVELTHIDSTKVHLTTAAGYEVRLSTCAIDQDYPAALCFNIAENENMIPGATYVLHLEAGAVKAGELTNEDIEAASWVAAGKGSDSNPFILTENVPCFGPKANVKTYYSFTANRDGILSLATTFTGGIVGYISTQEGTKNYRSKVVVRKGETATIYITTELNNTDKTITATLTDLSEGNTRDTAIQLKQGSNTIKPNSSNTVPTWYVFTAKAHKRSKLTFTGYPMLTAFVEDADGTVLTSNPVDYINDSDDDALVYVRVESTNDVELSASLTYGDPVADLTHFGATQFMLMSGEELTSGATISRNGVILVKFPGRVGGSANEKLTVNYYIFHLVGGNPDGAPVNLGGTTEATGTLSFGAPVMVQYGEGNYRLQLQSVASGSYSAPGMYEPYLENNSLDFTVGIATAITDVKAEDSTAPIYNLAGQRVSSHKGIVVKNGKKYIAK